MNEEQNRFIIHLCDPFSPGELIQMQSRHDRPIVCFNCRSIIGYLKIGEKIVGDKLKTDRRILTIGKA
jgi:hypothetical protein